MAEPAKVVLLHLSPGLREALDPDDVFFLESADNNTRVRTRSSRRFEDVRTLGELERVFRRWGFVRIHRNYIVNPLRVRQVRRRRTGEDWEVKLAPPVNRILPIGRTVLPALWKALGER